MSQIKTKYILDSAITNAKLANMAANTVKANVTGSSAAPTDVAAVSAATASAFMVRDANANAKLNSLIQNGTSTATAAGNTTLTVSSTWFQQFTGSTTQTVTLPDATTLSLYQSFLITNRSSGVVTVNANGGGLIQTMAAGSQTLVTVTSIGSSAGSWDSAYSLTSSGSSSSSARAINAQTTTTYTFALTDGSNNGNNPLVTFGSASPTVVTVPTNASVAFPVGSQIDTLQVGAGATQFAAASGVTINSLNGGYTFSGQYANASLVKTGTDTWDLYGELAPLIVATGGTITTDGNYKVHTFTTSGTFQITAGSGVVDSLVIAGGGGGGTGDAGNNTGGGGGGGGAGGMVYTSPGGLYNIGSYTVTIGSGGATDTSGSNSVFDTITATGGGKGGKQSVNSGNGSTGGSGGGAECNSGGTGGAGTAGQGNNGGGVTNSGTSGGAGGGGGSGGTGGAGQGNQAAGGVGGIGSANSISGSSVTYASGGGGGGAGPSGAGGTASAGGGGAGGSAGSTGTSGTANTGGGGGGGGNQNASGGTGGSGIVVLRYKFQ